MKLRCSSLAILLGAAPLLFSCCLNAWGAEWQALYVQPAHTVQAPQGHAFVGREMDFIPLGQQTYAATGLLRDTNTDWDTVHLRTGDDTLSSFQLPEVSMQDQDGKVPLKDDPFVANVARNPPARIQKRTLFLLNMAFFCIAVLVMHFAFLTYYKVRAEEALRAAAGDRRAIGAQGQGGRHTGEAAHGTLSMDDLYLAAHAKGHHLVPDAEYVKLVEKASAADMWNRWAGQAWEPPLHSVDQLNGPYRNQYGAHAPELGVGGAHGFGIPGDGYFRPEGGNYPQVQHQYNTNSPGRPPPYNPAFFDQH